MKHTLAKNERLKSKKYFDAIFEKGRSVKAYPIRAIFISLDEDELPDVKELPQLTQVAFAVPKKRFKHAVDRNRIKRKMREAYRLNKFTLNQPYAILLVYLPKEDFPFGVINTSIQKILKDIVNSKK